MDYVRKILNFLIRKQEQEGFVSFLYESTDDGVPKVITVHANEDGTITLTIFTQQEWAMVLDINDITDQDIEQIVKNLEQDGSVTVINFDPKEFF